MVAAVRTQVPGPVLDAHEEQLSLGRLQEIERVLARMRTGAALLSAVQFSLLEASSPAPTPFPRTAIGLVTSGALTAVNALSRRARRAADRKQALRLGRFQLAADAGVVTALVWLFSFDAGNDTWALMILPVLEAALRAQLPGALVVWAALGVTYVAGQTWASQVYGHRFVPGDLNYRLGAVLLVAVVSGSLANTLARQFAELSSTRSLLAHQATHDALTGLPNRRLLADRLEHALARRTRQPGPIGLIVVDLDRFKVVNDTLGHEVGDDALRRVAACLQASVRPGDTVSRQGGDEFVLLLEEAARAEAAMVAERVRVAVSSCPMDRAHSLSASVGLVWSDAPVPGAEALLRAADAAMYRAKASGGDRVASVFDAGFDFPLSP